MHQPLRMIAKTLQSLEPVLAQELIALGATEVEEGRRMVSFSGDKALLYRANYQLRTALRVLLPLAQFRASSPDELYEELRRLDWSQWMRPKDTFAFDSVVYSETFTHSKYVGYRAKDALVDYFQDKLHTRPNVRLDNPDLRFHIHIAGEEVTLALDSSGESLHKRGWRAAQTEAPMSEVLAAGILRLAGWEGQCDFIDPMCGSGTLLIEAAMIARGIAPGRYRQGYAFQRWQDYDAQLFGQVVTEAEAAERPFAHHIYGADAVSAAVQVARYNVRSAGLEAEVSVQHLAMQNYPQPQQPALLVTNPPYGERLRLREGEQLYSMIGERLKHNFAGCTAWIITDKAEHFAKIGLRPSVRYKLLNGAIECELRGYELFAGKQTEHKQAGEGAERSTPRIERRDRKPSAAKGRGDRPKRFEGDKPRRFEGGRPKRFDGDKPRRFDGDRKPRKPEGQLWPNDRFRYRDEEGRERIRSKRPSRLQLFTSEDKED